LTSNDLDKTLIFYDNKTFNDLFLDTIDHSSLISPSNLFVNTSPLSEWTIDTATSYSWTPITLNQYNGEKYDFSLGTGIVYTLSTGASFNFNVQIDKTGEYSVWVRLLFNPDGGNLTFSINNVGFNKEVDTFSAVLEGFKWVNLGEVYLNTGSYKIGFISENGFNAVNLVALPTVNDLTEHTQNLLNLINESNTTIAYVMDRPYLNSLNTKANTAEISIYAPQTSSYTIDVLLNQKIRGSLQVTVDNENLVVDGKASSDGPNWYSIGPIDVSQGSHIIKLSTSSSVAIDEVITYSMANSNNTVNGLEKVFGDGGAPYVVSYKQSGPTSFSVKVNATKAFILAFQEPYDEFWQSNISSTKLIIDSVANGFFANNIVNAIENHLVNININYTPEASFQTGVMISTISFALSLTTIFLILTFSKFKEKHRFSKTLQ
jgi:hypothetical protein